MKLSASIVIPARFKSSRFPGKPLAKINGRELILRVYDACKKSKLCKEIYVATDDRRIEKFCKRNKIKTIFTSKKCITGTDRVAEAALKISSDIIINVQGDEPLVSYKDIDKIIKKKINHLDKVICGYSKIDEKSEIYSNSVPKVIFNKKGELIYISRGAIPFSKKSLKIKKFNYYRQVCIYAFNKKELKKFNSSKQSIVEKIENVEILRFFDLNIKVLMVKTKKNTYAVDYPKDIKKIKNFFKTK